jgi:hypothetical protein
MFSLVKAMTNFMNCELRDPDGNEVEREIEFFVVSCSILTEARHRLVAEALQWQATHILWLDADHMFPADTIQRLLSHGKDVVGCNYARRAHPTAPTAAKTVKGERELVYTDFASAAKGRIEEVDHLGFGVVLMRTGIFDAMQDRAEKQGGKTMLPLFEFQPKTDGSGFIGEDAFFFAKVRDAGAKVYVDHGLSWEVGHVHEQILTNADAWGQKADFLKRNETQKRNFDKKIEEIS